MSLIEKNKEERILITGSEGFVGKHLAELLLADTKHVYGFDNKIDKHLNLADYDAVETAVNMVWPDKIFHLGALTYVPECIKHPHKAFKINTWGTLNILEAVKNNKPDAKIHIASSSGVYDSSVDMVTEDTKLAPPNAYAISKLAADQLGQSYAKMFDMHVVVTRAFSHAGPGRTAEFVESAFAKQIAEIERGERDLLRHGNLESIRNYSDVRDIVEAYKLAIDLPPDVYNVGSSHNFTMQQILNILRSHSTADFLTEVDPELYRPTDHKKTEASFDKFKNLTGWEAKISFEQTLKDVLNYWREQLST